MLSPGGALAWGAFAGLMASGPAQWDAPDGCPNPETVRRELEAVLPSDPDDELKIDASAIHRGERWLLSVAVVRGPETFRRELVVDSCTAAAEAAPLVAGLLISQSEAPPSDAEPQPEAPVDPDPAADPRAPSPAEVDAPREPPARPSSPPLRETQRPPIAWRGHAGIAGGVSLGGLGPGGEVLARIMVGGRRFRIGVRVGHEIRRRVRLENAADVGANVSALSAGPAASWVVPLDWGAWVLSGAVPLGGVRARGIGGTTRQTRWVPWPTVALGTAVEWAVTDRFGLRAEVEGRVALLRHRFVFDQRGLLRTGTVSGALLVGPTVRFFP